MELTPGSQRAKYEMPIAPVRTSRINYVLLQRVVSYPSKAELTLEILSDVFFATQNDLSCYRYRYLKLLYNLRGNLVPGVSKHFEYEVS